MYPYQPLSGRDAQARREQLWNTVLDYRHGAGLKLAADDLQERTRAEVARSLLLKEAGIDVDHRRGCARCAGGSALRSFAWAKRAGATVAGSPTPSTGTSS